LSTSHQNYKRQRVQVTETTTSLLWQYGEKRAQGPHKTRRKSSSSFFSIVNAFYWTLLSVLAILLIINIVIGSLLLLTRPICRLSTRCTFLPCDRRFIHAHCQHLTHYDCNYRLYSIIWPGTQYWPIQVFVAAVQWISWPCCVESCFE
jgi:hypothetical protein